MPDHFKQGAPATMTTAPRPYLSNNHLHDVITSDAGSIEVRPQEAGRIVFDVASANHLPADLPDSRNGSSVLDIGRGVQVRASGSAYPAEYQGELQYVVRDALHGSQYPSGRDLTAAQDARARAIIGELITGWAKTHAGDIAQADDIGRNNAARRLEEHIATHEKALAILRAELNNCDNGRDFTGYPDLPTER